MRISLSALLFSEQAAEVILMSEKLVAIGAVRECGEVTMLDPEEVPDDALIVPIAMMGAPTVLSEKGNRRKRI